jgi:hypothetical protein
VDRYEISREILEHYSDEAIRQVISELADEPIRFDSIPEPKRAKKLQQFKAALIA